MSINKKGRKREVYLPIFTFVLCQLIGTMVYFICALKFTFPRMYLFYFSVGTVLGIIILFINCSMILFVNVRVIFFLAIPSLITARLRALLLVLILTWSIQSSALNVTSNIKATAAGIICVQERVKILSTELKESADKNLRQVSVHKIQRFLQKSMQPFVSIRETLRNLDDSLTNMLSWQRSLIMRIRQLMDDCSTHAQAPYYACIGMLTTLHSQCIQNTYDFFCAPITLLKHLCYVSKVLELNCEWPKMVKKQMEEGVGHFVKESKRKTIEYAQKTVFYDIYSIGKSTEKAYETLEFKLNHSFSTEQQIDMRTDEFQKKLHEELGLIELFFQAKKYAKNFKTKNSIDNYHITNELKKFDADQRKQSLPTIFPLKEDEKNLYVRWHRRKIVGQECKGLLFSFALTLLSVGVPLVFVISDIFTYRVLNRAYDFFHSNFTRIPKPNIYHLKVSGDGFMAELLSNILKTFEPLSSDTEKSDSMWHSCFTEPGPPNYTLFRLMFILFVTSVALCFLQVYAKRFRHQIAGYYFPQRVLPRVIYLHNKILQARQGKKYLEEEDFSEEGILAPKGYIPSSTSTSTTSV